MKTSKANSMKLYNNSRFLFLVVFCWININTTHAQDMGNPYNPYYSNNIEGYIGALIQSEKNEKEVLDILLAKWGIEKVRSTLMRECQEKSGAEIAFRLKILGEIYDPSLVPLLQEFLNISDFRIRNAVAAVIIKRGYPSAAPLVGEYLLSNKVDQTTYFMIHSLEMIATSEALRYLEKLDQSALSENSLFTSQIDRSISVVEKYLNTEDKTDLLEQYLQPESKHEDFNWAIRKIYQKPTSTISLEYVNRLYESIDNKDQIASSIYNPDYSTPKSEKQIHQETGYFMALLKLRKHLGGQISEREESLLEMIEELSH